MYGRDEMMVYNMAEQGVLGEIVHCEGAYRHDIREEIAFGKENRHYLTACPIIFIEIQKTIQHMSWDLLLKYYILIAATECCHCLPFLQRQPG